MLRRNRRDRSGFVQSLLDRAHVFSPGTLGTFAFIEGNPLTFVEVFEATFNIRHVEEKITTTTNVDESVSLVRQFLDRTLWHSVRFLKMMLNGRA